MKIGFICCKEALNQSEKTERSKATIAKDNLRFKNWKRSPFLSSVIQNQADYLIALPFLNRSRKKMIDIFLKVIL